MRMLAVLHREFDPRTRALAVEEPFRVPLVDMDTGEVLDRDLVGTVDLLERDAVHRLVVVDDRGTPVGVLSGSDLVREIADFCDDG